MQITRNEGNARNGVNMLLSTAEKPLVLNQITGAQSEVFSFTVEKKKKKEHPLLPQNRQTVKKVLDEIKLSAENKLIMAAISQFIDSRIPDIIFFL